MRYLGMKTQRTDKERKKERRVGEGEEGKAAWGGEGGVRLGRVKKKQTCKKEKRKKKEERRKR